MSITVPAALAAMLTLAAPEATTPAAPAKPASTPTTTPGTAPVTTTTTEGLIDPSGEWRAARWGMSAIDVLRHFTGEAKAVEPELKLPNGNVVSVRIDGQVLVGQPVRAAFVFEEGKLAMVSLRTPERHYAPVEAYQAALQLVTAQLGRPRSATSNSEFIEQRQATWVLPKGGLELKYIPGVLVLLYHPL